MWNNFHPSLSLGREPRLQNTKCMQQPENAGSLARDGMYTVMEDERGHRTLNPTPPTVPQGLQIGSRSNETRGSQRPRSEASRNLAPTSPHQRTLYKILVEGNKTTVLSSTGKVLRTVYAPQVRSPLAIQIQDAVLSQMLSRSERTLSEKATRRKRRNRKYRTPTSTRISPSVMKRVKSSEG
ncbi:hypothetical protein IAD21_02439 [Abditibacteriota bacterium]|nr:hypothetical protein IAD21_02439 [Abditibacteriota bacterium]